MTEEIIPLQNGGRIRIEILFSSATKGVLNSLQFEKWFKFAIIACARFIFVLTRHNGKRTGVHSNSAAIQHFATCWGILARARIVG